MELGHFHSGEWPSNRCPDWAVAIMAPQTPGAFPITCGGGGHCGPSSADLPNARNCSIWGSECTSSFHSHTIPRPCPRNNLAGSQTLCRTLGIAELNQYHYSLRNDQQALGLGSTLPSFTASFKQTCLFYVVVLKMNSTSK